MRNRAGLSFSVIGGRGKKMTRRSCQPSRCFPPGSSGFSGSEHVRRHKEEARLKGWGEVNYIRGEMWRSSELALPPLFLSPLAICFRLISGIDRRMRGHPRGNSPGNSPRTRAAFPGRKSRRSFFGIRGPHLIEAPPRRPMGGEGGWRLGG